MWDTFAIILAIAAIALRWYDDPRAAGVLAYAAMACGFVARRQARARGPEHADAD